MRWRDGRRSRNIEDRRGQAPRIGAVRGGLGTIIVALALGYFLGIDPSVLLQLQQGMLPDSVTTTPHQATAHEQELADFVAVVLADTEDTWHAIFQASGQRYEEPGLVLFSGAVQSACGSASAAMGPFYCPEDRKVYLDLDFFNELARRHGAPGDFAQAYVIAHEVGHHVQNLLGINARVRTAQQGLGKEQVNALSVQQELQADCFAGLWGFHANRSRQVLEAGDIEEALGAASAIGDDTLQKQAQGYVVPESFTHGSARQRVAWFRRGIEHGSVADCNTYN